MNQLQNTSDNNSKFQKPFICFWIVTIGLPRQTLPMAPLLAYTYPPQNPFLPLLAYLTPPPHPDSHPMQQ